MTDLDRLRARVAELEAALETARAQLVACDEALPPSQFNEKDGCVETIAEIDAALAGTSPAPSPEAYVKAGIEAAFACVKRG